MPRGDSTGPNGRGPATGRGFGFCTGNKRPGFNEGYGRGRGSRRNPGGTGRGQSGGFAGQGRGFRNMNYAGGMPGSMGSMDFAGSPSMTKEEEIRLLHEQADALNKEMQNINQRISELESITE